MLYRSAADRATHAEGICPLAVGAIICIKLIGSDCASAVPVEEERLELNAEEVVLDPGQETRAGAAQLGVCETSGKSGRVLIRSNFLIAAFNCISDSGGFLITGKWRDVNRRCGPGGSRFNFGK